MKKIVLFIALIFPVLLTGCIHDCITDPPTDGTTITITADLPDRSANPSGNDADMPDTRVALTQDNVDVDINWEEGDELDLCVVYGALMQKQTVVITRDPENYKKATFSLTLPEGSYTTFDLYGVFGGGGLCEDTGKENLALFPSAANSTSSSLDVLQDNKVIMLKFAKTGISKASPNLSVNFEHMGSLFRILIKNAGESTWSNITSAQLTATGTTPSPTIPAYPNTGSSYYVTSGTFSGAQGTTLSFAPISSSNIVPGGILDLWGWFPVEKGEGEGVVWPALNLKVTAGGSEKTSSTAKPSRKATTGKAYHLYAKYDGSNLIFTTGGSMEVADGKLADKRDGNLYNTVTLWTQTWMAQNLMYLPAVNPPSSESNTEPYYYVYGYNSSSVSEAKVTTNFLNYGVLYNWHAAMAACPDGWHLPSDDEWKQLEMNLGMTEIIADETGQRGTNEGNLLKESGLTHWHSPSEGADSYFFTALPGGLRDGNSNTFNFISYLGYWWCSTENNTDVWYRNLAYNGGYVNRSTYYKEYGLSVRCVKDA